MVGHPRDRPYPWTREEFRDELANADYHLVAIAALTEDLMRTFDAGQADRTRVLSTLQKIADHAYIGETRSR